MTIAYEEILDFIAAGTTPQGIVDFKPSEATRSRVWELVHRQKSVALSEEESTELESYLQLEHLMRMAKAKARQHLDTDK